MVIQGLVRFADLGRWAFVAWCSLQAVRALAGKDTNVDVLTRIVTKLTSNDAFSWMLVAIFGGWAYRERSLRKRKVRALVDMKNKLEAELDPGRTSSQIQPDGSTNPKDDL